MSSDDVLDVDIDHLTVGEIEEIEELTGQSIDQLGESGTPKGKLMRALGFVTRKRTNPDFTWDDAGRLKVQLAGGVPVPPTDASD